MQGYWASKTRGSDPVTDAMDKAHRLHLWRKNKNGKNEEACQNFEKRVIYAKELEQKCRNGELHIDDFKKLIGREYEYDAVFYKDSGEKET